MSLQKPRHRDLIVFATLLVHLDVMNLADLSSGLEHIEADISHGRCAEPIYIGLWPPDEGR